MKVSRTPQRKRHLAVVGKYAPLDEEKQNYEQYDALFEALEIEQLYIIGSFNGWLPIPMIKGLVSSSGRMTSQQTELLGQNTGFSSAGDEKGPNTAPKNDRKVPPGKLSKAAATMKSDPRDSKIHKLSLFMKPGRHHFFFVRKGRTFMLSQEYDTECYKETNLKMNYIDVERRGWRINPPPVNRDDEWKDMIDESDDEEEVFDKAKSVFKNFKTDTEALLRRSFENDWRLTKIPKLVKDKEELHRVKVYLGSIYPRLKNMFLALACDSAYPNFSFNDYSVWCQKCTFLNKEQVGLADLDNVLVGACVKTDQSKKIEGAKGEMMRFEFLECLVRMAQLLYKSELVDAPAGAKPKDDKAKR